MIIMMMIIIVCVMIITTNKIDVNDHMNTNDIVSNT